MARFLGTGTFLSDSEAGFIQLPRDTRLRSTDENGKNETFLTVLSSLIAVDRCSNEP
ncbi:unnamed protein product, partial [Amoebophrya sp. A120]|eukprot:GSA120T00001126001.1